MWTMRRPSGSASGVTPHAKVLFSWDVDRSTKLCPIRRSMGVVAHYAGDGPEISVALLQVVRGFTEGDFKGFLALVARHTGFGNSAGICRVGPGAVSRL